MSSMFDLEKAIATWRRSFEHNRVFSPEDLEELERHLRDHAVYLTSKGLSEEAAFETALQSIGDYGSTEAEYGKVFWEKAAHHHTFRHEITWRLAMLKNYLTIALRQLRRQKIYAFINVTGLALGLATCLLIGLFILHEWSYDRHFPNADRIYRIYQEWSNEDDGIAATPPGLIQFLEDTYPEIEHATKVNLVRRVVTLPDRDPFYLDNVVLADSQFLQVFPFRILRGNPAELLNVPGQLVVTESTAALLFGEQDPIGQTLTIGNTSEYTVTGVIEDVPSNTHFQFTALQSMDADARAARQSTELAWDYFSRFDYVKLYEGASAEALEEKIRVWEAEVRPERTSGTPIPWLRLEALTNIHLYLDLINEIAPQSDVRYLYLVGVIGLFILLIACVNYINLATARSMERAREIGVRKVVGAHQGQLAKQFLSESLLFSLLSVPVALLLTYLAAPLLESATGEQIPLRLLSSMPVLLGLLTLIGITGLLGGWYPALLLSRLRPVAALTSRSRGMGRTGHLLRQGLVVFQFTATIVLLLGAFVVKSQLDYIRNKNLGFDEEYVVTVNLPGQVAGQRYDVIKRALEEQRSILSVSGGVALGANAREMAVPQTDEHTGERRYLERVSGSYGYLETLGIDLIAGRSFDPQYPTDVESAVILTASAARWFELGENPIGQTIPLAGDEYEVIGLIADIHNTPLRESLMSLVIRFDPGPSSMLIRLRPENIQDGLAAIENVWSQVIPDRPFTFEFLDEQIAAQYELERELGFIATVFTMLSLFIAGIGLFGLAAFAASKRTKEIGIRKVFGATVGSIVALLSKDFLKLVLIAFVIAAPLAYFAMNRWLEDFAYRIEIGPGIFLLAGALALLIALATVSYQSIKAALANPVKSLRYE
jgi:putative ABC transport system permease protein